MIVPCEAPECINYANMIWKGQKLCISCAEKQYRDLAQKMKAEFYLQIEHMNEEFIKAERQALRNIDNYV